MTRSSAIICLLLIFCVSFSIKAEEKLNILLEGPEDVIHVGDVTQLDLTMWPIEKLKNINLQKLEGQTIGESLVVISVKRPSVSQNNEQAVETKIRGVFLQEAELPSEIEIEKEKINLMKRSIAVTGEVAQIKKLNVFQQADAREMSWGWPILLLICSAVGLRYFLVKRNKKNRDLEAFQKEENFWRGKLKAADSRQEYEHLYAAREKWSKKLNPPSRELIGFCQALEKIQYKKEWNEEEEQQIKQTINELRRRTLM
jgi:hypothetical protein